MEYQNVQEAIFLERPNRFIAMVKTKNGVQRVHVKNTGRCRELLVPGAKVWVSFSDAPGRKTPGDLICVQKGSRLINIDSQAPNQVAAEYLPFLFAGLDGFKGEQTFEDSRFDFYFEADGKPGFLEVKGVTLEENGVVRFPDAPTQRGAKHLQGLIRAKQAGLRAAVLFVVQMQEVAYFAPNDATDPAFAKALRQAAAAGVELYAVDCLVTPSSLVCQNTVPIRL